MTDHRTFAELQWTRAPFEPDFCRLPPGFRALGSALPADLSRVLEDIHALQCTREELCLSQLDFNVLMAQVLNHVASIHSRLAAIAGLSPVLECCRLAAFLCSSMLCCHIWCALTIPVRAPTHVY